MQPRPGQVCPCSPNRPSTFLQHPPSSRLVLLTVSHTPFVNADGTVTCVGDFLVSSFHVLAHKTDNTPSFETRRIHNSPSYKYLFENMGICMSNAQEREEKARSDKIDKMIEEDGKKFKRECKILLLGMHHFFV
jgi:hypothetical protein